jgi:hypothetical protein
MHVPSAGDHETSLGLLTASGVKKTLVIVLPVITRALPVWMRPSPFFLLA